VLIRATSCSPETLARLQRIFDAVWREVEQQKGKRIFPWDIEATRFTIARLVLEHGRDLRNPAQIKREALGDLEQIGDTNRQSQKGAPPAAEARAKIDAKEVRALLKMLQASNPR
jgi:hypothetical protein